MVVQNALGVITRIKPAAWARIAALSAGASVGVGAGVMGTVDTVKGIRIRNDVQKRLDRAVTEYESSWVRMERTISEFCTLREGVYEGSVTRFLEWLVRNEHLVAPLNLQALDEEPDRVLNVRRHVADIKTPTARLRVPTVFGLADPMEAFARFGVTRIAHAGTGRRIASISGATAERALIAWFAGGPEALGAGGMKTR